QNVTSLSGTADDTLTGSGVNEIDIAIIDGINRFWNGATWTGDCSTSCNPWQTATFTGASSGTWSYSTLSGAFSNYNFYRAVVRRIDKGGTPPGNPSLGAGGTRFNVAGSTPTSLITSPVSGTIMKTGIPPVTETANDVSVNAAGVATVKVRIGRNS